MVCKITLRHFLILSILFLGGIHINLHTFIFICADFPKGLFLEVPQSFLDILLYGSCDSLINEKEVHHETIMLSPKATFVLGLGDLSPQGNVTNIVSKCKNNYYLKAPLTHDIKVLYLGEATQQLNARLIAIEVSLASHHVCFCEIMWKITREMALPLVQRLYI